MRYFIALLTLVALSASAANPIRNSGFELPTSVEFGYYSSDLTETKPFKQWIVTNDPATGKACLEFQIDATVINYAYSTAPFYLAPGSTQTVSFDCRRVGTGTPRVFIESSSNSVSLVATNYKPGTSWERFKYQQIIPTNEPSWYRLVFDRLTGTGTSYVDNVTIRSDGLTNYEASAAIEVGVRFSRDDKVYLTTDAITANVEAWGTGSATVKWESRDYWNSLVSSGSFPVDLAASHATNAITFGTSGEPGAYRVLAWVNGMDNTLNEATAIVVRPVADLDGAAAGSHWPVWPYFAAAANRSGAPWSRLMSVTQLHRWNVAEPTDDNFVYYTNAIGTAYASGNRLLMTIGSDMSHVPAYAKNPTNAAIPDMTQYFHYASNMIRAYGPWVDAYEAWNEPDTEGDLVSYPDVYAEMMTTVAALRDALDPTAKVLLLTVTDEYATNILGRISADDFDTFAHHFYPGTYTAAIINAYRTNLWDVYPTKDVWNTESGGLNKTFFMGWDWWLLSDYLSGADYDSRSEYLYPLLRSIGYGASKVFQYDARNTLGVRDSSEFTLLDSDFGPKAYVVSLNAISHFLSGVTNRQRLALDSDLELYGVEADGRNTVFGWITNAGALKLVGADANAVFYDHSGTSHGGTSYVATLHPFYLSSMSLSLSDITNSMSFQAATDTEPPNLILTRRPFGPATDLRFTAFAMDNDSTYRGSYVSKTLIRTRLSSHDTNWTAWTQSPAPVGWSGVSPSWVFEAEAMDAASNVVAIGASWNDGGASATANTVNVGTLNIGQ